MSTLNVTPEVRSALARATALRDKGEHTILHGLSFHMFHDAVEGHILYDIASGTVVSVSPETADLLTICREHAIAEARDRIEDRGWDIDECMTVVNDMLRSGFFRYVPLDTQDQDRAIDSLWSHKPRRLQLLFAQMCNLKCIYCYEEANGSNARKRLMSFEMAKQSVDYLVERSGPRRDIQVTFFGGEPLLNFKTMVEVVAYCREIEKTRDDKRFVFETITNGVLLTEDKVEFFIKEKFMLMISLDGNESMNNFNRPSVSGSNYHAEIVKNAQDANRAYMKAGLGSPKVRANLTHQHHDFTGTVRYLEGLGFRTLGVAAIQDLPWSEAEASTCTQEDLDEIAAQRRELLDLALAKDARKERLSPFERKLVRETVEKVDRSRFTRGLRCGVGRNTNIVDCEGNIYPCHRYGDMGQYILGNVKTGELDREKMFGYYKTVNQAASSKCQVCWARHMCSGPCAWESSHPDGQIHEPDERFCKRVRSSSEYGIVLRERIKRESPHLLPDSEVSGCGSCGVG